MNNRIRWIDFAKGFLMFFVLVAHVLSGVYTHNLYPNGDHYLIFLADIIYMFIMPVFFALSGYFFKSPKNKFEYVHMIYRKALSLLIPYVVFSILYVAMQHTSNSIKSFHSWESLLTIWYQPISYLWFLYTLFGIFLVVGFFSLIRINILVQGLIYLFLMLSTQFFHLPHVVSLVFSCALFFYLGMLSRIYINWVQKKVVIIISFILSIISFAFSYNIAGLSGDYDYPHLWNFVTKAILVIFFFGLFSRLSVNAFFTYFEKYGKSSLTIYMIHFPAISAFRTLILHFFLPNIFVMTFLLIILGWYSSLFVVWLNKKYRWLDIVFNPNQFFNQK